MGIPYTPNRDEKMWKWMVIGSITDLLHMAGKSMQTFADSVKNTADRVREFHAHQQYENNRKGYDDRIEIAKLAVQVFLEDQKIKVDKFRTAQGKDPMDWGRFMCEIITHVDDIFGEKKKVEETVKS
jgi:hypothetical protein